VIDTRRAYPTVYYNGVDISATVDKYLQSFQFTDPASGESDSLSLTLGNWDGRWLSSWFPDKGATLDARVHAYHWTKPGEILRLQCGRFLLDEISFSGIPDVITMGGVSTPADEAFKTTKRTKTWEDVTVDQIALDIATRYKLALVYDAPTIKVEAIEQSGETDSAFLEKICKDYGLSLKVYNNKLVVFDREEYKKKPPVKTIDKGEMLNYTFNTTLTETYTGGELVYTNQDGEEVTYKTGSGPRILKSNESASNAAEAKRKLDAAIANANHGESTISFSTIGQPLLFAGQVIKITGLGRANSTYYIDKLTHSVGDAYTTSFECSDTRNKPKTSEDDENARREQVVAIMRGWLGYSGANGKYKEIVDLYNNHEPLARDYKLQYTDAWCAAAVSAAFIEAGMTDIAPTEVSCSQMIERYKELGQWQEDDGYVPKPGDVIMYDWQDGGTGDNRGGADHVGIVEKVEGTVITVIEGNKNNAVERRTVTVGGQYIRGYGTPNY